ncbi:hypothetical protein IGI04_036387 [Brassica rapa subsp. trilocularis]|uniref:Uncharacterized protein n=1 Tax=Brassica rapa subsp. trilocularis TaxID=1813537 RepID=A0ABQ7LEB0_BRACM|nr:hypothetical protein IGI04_036387 [Brassica rapa subsp. trilocularis]
MGVRQHTQDVCGCPWLSVSTHRTSVANRVCLCVSICVRQHTQDIRVRPSAHTGRLWLSISTHRTSVADRVCPSAHTGRPCLSISTHISTLVLGLSTLTLPVDCLGDFGQRGLSVQYTQDVRGCLPAHTGRPWLSVCVRQHTQASVAVHQYTYQHVGPWTQHAGPSGRLFGTHRTSVAVRVCPFVSVSTHMTSVGVRQHLQDVRVCPSAHTGHLSVCPCVSVSTHRTSVAVHQYTYQYVGPWTQHAGPSRGLFGTSVAVRGYPSAHTGHPWLTVCVCEYPFMSVSTHKTSVCVRQHTLDVRGCPWLSVSTHRTSVAVRVCPSAHTGRRPWVSASTHRTSMAVPVCPSAHTGVCGCPPVHISARWSLDSALWPFPSTVWVILADVGCLFSTQNVRVCPPAHTGRRWLSVSTQRMSVAVRVCPFVSVSTHRTSVGVRQHTQDVRVCPSAHTGHLWLSVCVRGCPSAHTGHSWLSISTHISTLVLGLSTLALPVDCLGDFGQRRLSVQYTQDVNGCPLANIGRPWLSVSVCVCLCVSMSTHTRRLWLSISTYISTLVLGLSTLALPVDCSADFGPRGLSVHYTEDVRGCSSAHTGRPCVSISTHRTFMAVHVCPFVSISTHRTSVAVHQYTYQHVGPWTQQAGPSRGLFGTHMTSMAVHQYTYQHVGSWTLTLPVDCSGDFGQRGLSVQYTQDVRGCPPAHTGRPWLSVCVRQHTQASVAVHQYTYQHVGPWTQHAGPSGRLFGTSVAVRQHTQDVCGCPCVSVSPHRTSVGVRQHTQDVCVCPSAHTGHLWLSVCNRVCPSAHTGHLWLSISTQISTLVLGLSTLALPVDCLGDFGPRGLSVQYTQDVRGCPPANTGRPWLSVAVRVCLCVSRSTHTRCLWLSISTHISTLVLGVSTLALPMDCSGDFGPCGLSVHYTEDVCGCSSAHTGRPCMSVSTHRTTLTLPVDCSGDFGPRGLSVQYTQYVHGCPPAHTGHPWLSVCVRLCPSDHTGRPWLSISRHISTLVLGLNTLALPVDCSGDFGPRGLFVQYIQDVRGCPPTHTQDVYGCPCVSVCVCQHTQDVRGYPSVHISARWSMDSARWPFPYTVRVILAHVGCLFSTHWTSVGVRQHTQDVCGRLCVSVSTHMTCLAVHKYSYQHVGPWTQHADPSRGLFGLFWPMWAVCSIRTGPHTGRPWLSISTHIGTLVFGISTLALPVDCLGDFGPCGLSVQYTQDVHGCLPAHKGRPWLSVSTHRTSVAVRVCLCVSICVRQHTEDVCGCPLAHTGRQCLSASTHRSSVVVRVCPSEHTGRLWLSISTHISTLVLGLSTLDLHVDCSGDFGPRGLSVQYTQDVCVSVSTHKMSVCVRQHTQDVRGCLAAHTGRPWLSVCVRQHTQDVRGCPSVHISALHTGRPWMSASTHRTSVAVCVCPSMSVSTHWTSVAVHLYTYSTLVLGLNTLALPVDCSGDFGPCGLSVQYTQDVSHTGRPWVSVSTHRTSVAVRGCPSTHTGRPWLSHSTHFSTLVIGLSTLTLPMDCSGDFGQRRLSVQYTQDVSGCPLANLGRPWLSVSVCVCLCVSMSTHTRRLWLSISTYISTLVLGLSTLALPVDCSADFGPRGLSVHYTEDVRGCSSAHTGRPCVSISTHRTFMAVHVCPFVSISTHRTSVAVHQYTYQHVGPWTQQAGPSRGLFGTHMTSMAVHQYTYQHVGSWTLTLPVDCSGDFGQRGLSVQYTQDVRGCPPAHTGRPWLSVCVRQHTQASVAVHQYTYQHVGPWTQHAGPSGRLFGTSVAVRQHTQDVCGCPCVSVSPHRTSVGVRQHTQDVCVCPSAHTGHLWLSVCNRVCPSAHTGHLWLSISTQISTLVLGLSTLALPVDCLGDFGPRGLSVQYTQDVCGCPPANTGRPWLSVAVRVCLCVHEHTHKMSVAVHQYTYQHAGTWSQHAGPTRGLFGTLTLPVDCSGDFGPRGLSVQYTQYVHGCPPAHTGHPWLSVCVRLCPSDHTGRPWLSISRHISTLVLGLNTLALPVDCSGDFGPRGLFVQYIQDVRGCPPTHTQDVYGCPCVSVCVCQHTQDVRGYPSVHISARWSMDSARWPFPYTVRVILAHVGCLFSTHWTSVGVRQHTHDVCGRLCVSVSTHRTTSVGVRQQTQNVRGSLCVSVCVRLYLSAHTGRPWLSISTHIGTLVFGISTLALPVDCLGDFGPCGLSVQYTQDVHGCLPAHKGRPWLSVSTHRTSVAVRVCLCVSICVRQHTEDVCGCPLAHTGRQCLSASTHRSSVVVRVCPSEHTGRLWLSISTHISTLVLGLSTLDLHVDCSAHTGRPWLSVSTYRTSVAVRVCPSAHTGRSWLSISTHISTLVLGLSTLILPVDCLGDFSPRGYSVQYTQDVRGCPLAHTGHLWLSVCVRLCLSAHTGLPWVSICTHTARWSLDSTRWPFLWTVRVILAHVGCLFSTHRTSVGVRQHAYDVYGCPCVSVCVRQHIQDIRGYPSVQISARWSLDSARWPFPYTVRVILAHVGCLFSTHRTSVGVRQHTQDVCGCPWVSVNTHRTSMAVPQYSFQHVGHWTQHADPSHGLFG